MATTNESMGIGIATSGNERIINDSESGDFENINNSGNNTIIEPVENGTRSRRRGRPTGSGKNSSGSGKNNTGNNSDTRTNGKKKAQNIDYIKNSLQFAHAVVAKMTEKSNPALSLVAQLSDTEAVQMADSIAELAKYYDFEPEPKTAALINILVVFGGIYGAKAVQYSLIVSEMNNKQLN